MENKKVVQAPDAPQVPDVSIDCEMAEQLAREGEALSTMSMEQRIAEVADDPGAVKHVLLAFEYMSRKESAVSAGTYKSPEAIQREPTGVN